MRLKSKYRLILGRILAIVVLLASVLIAWSLMVTMSFAFGAAVSPERFAIKISPSLICALSFLSLAQVLAIGQASFSFLWGGMRHGN